MYDICIGCPHLGSQGGCNKGCSQATWAELGKCPWRIVPVEDSPLERIASEVGKLCAEKNLAYGASFDKCGDYLRLLYPNGIRPEQYVDALALARLFDKTMRIATRKDAFGESPYRDIAGYGLLGAARDERAK